MNEKEKNEIQSEFEPVNAASMSERKEQRMRIEGGGFSYWLRFH